MPIRVVCATRMTRDQFTRESATGRSLHYARSVSPAQLLLFAQNERGLSSVYNEAIDKARGEPAVLVFMHDDVLITDYHWGLRVREALQRFDLVGLAGNVRRMSGQASWIMADGQPQRDDPSHFSGAVGHGSGYPAANLSHYGDVPRACKLLDGVFLAIDSRTLARTGLRFDEQFAFHGYDADFCMQADRMGLRLGTFALSIVHESRGRFGSKPWAEAHRLFCDKWDAPALASPVVHTHKPADASALNCVIRVPAKDSYSTAGKTLMGRQSANEGFLTSWFQHSGHREFWCLARYREEAQVFARIGEGVLGKPAESPPVYRWIAQNQIHRVSGIGTAFLPGPQVADMAWIRRRDPLCRATDFSLVGMTHTTCEQPIQDGLANMLIAPVYPWDAQICPSPSVRTMVHRLLEDEARWLREHLGATQIRMPQLPVLPLGVDWQRMTPEPQERLRRRLHWRQRWRLGDDQVCVLYVGRLDLRTKANLFPTFDALELASRNLQQDGLPGLVLVLAGWFASEWDEKTVREGIAQACPSVRVVVEDGRQSEVREGVWHAADLFTSLVDNIQETFGLTPIEAMAAGLPVVVSDYDGYRDSVREGVDGYRITTWHPPAGQGMGLIDTHADLMMSYAEYVNRASAMIGIDVAQAAAAYERLARDPTQRRLMGEQGREHARTRYDWKALIPQYQELFAQLAAQRQEARSSGTAPADWTPSESATSHLAGCRHPRRSDPFHLFAHYPSSTLHEAMRLKLGPAAQGVSSAWEQSLQRHLERPVYQGLRDRLPAAQLLALLRGVKANPRGVSLISLAGGHAPGAGVIPTTDAVWAQVGWLIKSGFLSPVEPSPPS